MIRLIFLAPAALVAARPGAPAGRCRPALHDACLAGEQSVERQAGRQAAEPIRLPLTLPIERRPKWLREQGIVMAGSWEPLPFRVRRDGSSGYQPTPKQLEDYRREHSPQMVERLKALGVNFVMMHCYKGAGLEAERQSMAEAAAFARLCHERGLHVGVYAYSGAFLWELFFKEVPEAKDWVVLDAAGKPVRYGRVAYRYYWNRNHPAAEAYYRKIVRFAVEQIGTDLLHFDNYAVGPGWDECSVRRFRQFLRRRFSNSELAAMGIADVSTAEPPGRAAKPLLRFAWDEFRCRSLAESYWRMGRYARGLRPDVLLECNPGGVGPWIRPPRDHGRLLQGGEAFWDEGREPGFRNGRLQCRIRTYKVARAMNNMAFCYTLTPLAMAESMAFNLDCLGAICWFEYGRIVNRPGSREPVSESVEPFIRFYRSRRDLFRGTRQVADVAVLRSFPSQVFGGPRFARMTDRVERALIEGRVPFTIIHDHQLAGLRPPKLLVLAGCVAMSDEQVQQVRRFVERGGRLCIIGPAATHDEWLRPRKRPPLSGLPKERVVQVEPTADPVEAIERAAAGQLSLRIDAPAGLCCELTEQPNRRLVHLVNYRPDKPASRVEVRLRLPAGCRATAVTLASPEHAGEVPVAFQQQGGSLQFTVPAVRTYEIAVVRFERE